MNASVCVYNYQIKNLQWAYAIDLLNVIVDFLNSYTNVVEQNSTALPSQLFMPWVCEAKCVNGWNELWRKRLGDSFAL